MTCTVCSSPERAELERRLVQGASQRAMATQFGLGRSAIRRHVSAGHVPVAVVVAEHDEREAHALDLTSRVEFLWRKASSILQRAEAEGRPTVELAAVRELRATVELLGRLTGGLSAVEDVPVRIKLEFGSGEPVEPPAWLRPRTRVQLPEPSADR